MKYLLLLFLFLVPFNAFCLSMDDSLLGLSSTKIRVLFGEPTERIEYKLLNKSSFVYPAYVLYFKNDALDKIVYRNETQPTKKIEREQVQETQNDASSDLVSEMFSSK